VPTVANENMTFLLPASFDLDHDVRSDFRALADLYLGSDDRIGPDLNVRIQFGLMVDQRGFVNFFI
jgi:hypothetical protein